MPPDGGFFCFLGMPCKCPPADMLTLYSYLHGKQIVDGYIEVVGYFLELISGGRRFFPFDNRAASKAELSLQFR